MPNVTTGCTLAMFADDSKCYKCIESIADFFADDSKCYKCIESIADFNITHSDLDNLPCWSLAKEMNFQLSKCENLRVSRKRISPVLSYSLDSIRLKVVSSVQDLGVMVTIARIFPHPCGARKNTTQLAKYPHVLYDKPSNKMYILFVFKCKLGYINFCIDNYVSFYTGSSRRGASRIFLKNVYFRDSIFVRIPNL